MTRCSSMSLSSWQRLMPIQCRGTLGNWRVNMLIFKSIKHDPYRLRYGEILGKDLHSVEPGFLTYAVKDAIVTHRIYSRLVEIAKRLVEPFRTDMQPDAVARFGLLTETIQVRAAIALAAISRHGMHLDQQVVSTVRERLQLNSRPRLIT